MERKFGIELECLRNSGLEYGKVLEIIKSAGFDAIFSNQYNTKTVGEIKKKADLLGIDVEFLHAPFRGINNFWCAGDDYLSIKDT
ncbi:MAG: hypothetical protein IKZ59_00495, partial [Clostridia bacterium]|nr:hypothetical protein [Clostridia bacterium]